MIMRSIKYKLLVVPMASGGIGKGVVALLRWLYFIWVIALVIGYWPGSCKGRRYHHLKEHWLWSNRVNLGI